MHPITAYEPKRFWQFFYDITQIPRGSGNTRAVSDYLAAFARNHGLYYEQDELNNIIMIREATPGHEDVPALILQGHMDMVCEQAPDKQIDMSKDPLTLNIDGDWLSADGTTLGADDGVAIAYGLVLMEKDFVHPRLELILTVDEETGMDGARGINTDSIKGRRMINLDSEEEGIFIASCAGGERIDATREFELTETSGELLSIEFSGFRGGHSGTEINVGHVNANIAAARMIYEASRKVPVRLISFSGGERDNVIPNRTAVSLCTGDGDAFCAALQEQAGILRHELRASDGDFVVTCTANGTGTVNALSEVDQDAFFTLLLALPNGTHVISREAEDLVETSSNLGILKLEGGALKMGISCRSMRESALDYTVDRIVLFLRHMGCTCNPHSKYSGWEYDPDSKVRHLLAQSYKELFGQEPEILNLHAGVECGIFMQKLPGLDCVSIGPQMYDIHTARERVSISSCERYMQLLFKFIENDLK